VKRQVTDLTALLKNPDAILQARRDRALPTVYRFGDFRLDCGSHELLRGDRPVKLERKPMELLVLFTSRQGQLVTRAEIAERLWATDVYVDIEHGINTAIRKLRIELRDDPAEPKFIRTVTGIGYCFVAPVVAESAPALHEISASLSAPVPDEPAAPNLPAAQPRARHIIGMKAAVAIVLLAGLVLGSLRLLKLRRNTAAPVITSLAVIPLDNFSGDSSQEYFADGMTDELTTMLARNSTLAITSRTSVMQYKGAHRPLSEIAHSLGVDGIVEGSIARKGDRVHMTLQLIRVDTDSHIWAESFDRDESDTALAEEAAQEIAKQLKSATPVAKAQRYINPAAHDAYLRGKYLWMGPKMQESGAYYRKATEIQPDYAAAWAGLADYYGEGAAANILDPRTALGNEEVAAKRALALDPDLAEAHMAMAASYLIARWDWVNADIEIQHGIKIDPRDGELYYLQDCVMDAMNRKADAIEAAKKSVELAPYERPAALAEQYSFDHQYDAALAELHLRLESMPNHVNLLWQLADTLRRKGNYKESVDAWARLSVATGDPQTARQAQRAFQQGGERGFVRWQLRLREMEAKSEYISPVELASYHAQLGERNSTLALLEEGYRQRSTDMLWLQEDPAYDFLRTDPQFQSILKRVGRPPAPASQARIPEK
jgi:TolB-like protein/DNA-binding winged helix-turn-helix (wHTH) protein